MFSTCLINIFANCFYKSTETAVALQTIVQELALFDSEIWMLFEYVPGFACVICRGCKKEVAVVETFSTLW